MASLKRSWQNQGLCLSKKEMLGIREVSEFLYTKWLCHTYSLLPNHVANLIKILLTSLISRRVHHSTLPGYRKGSNTWHELKYFKLTMVKSKLQIITLSRTSFAINLNYGKKQSLKKWWCRIKQMYITSPITYSKSI